MRASSPSAVGFLSVGFPLVLPLRQLYVAVFRCSSSWAFSSSAVGFLVVGCGLSLRWLSLCASFRALLFVWGSSLRVGLVSSCGALLFVWGSSLRVGLFSSCGVLLFAWGSSLRVGLFTLCLGSLLFIVWGTLLSSCGDFLSSCETLLSSCGGFSLRVGALLFV